MVKLLFPTPIFVRDLLDDKLHDRQKVDADYMLELKQAMDAMRKQDPVGRRVSNQYTGWQSNDGINTHPTFTKLFNRIGRLFEEEVVPYYGGTGKFIHRMGNSWGNINDHGAWNAPHLHNGCWYSGVLYIHADGDEGDLQFVDPMPKYVNDMPFFNDRARTDFRIQPRTGLVILFPSAAMHMVEPNFTDKRRYSISFNVDWHATIPIKPGDGIQSHAPANENEFNIDPSTGNLINNIV